MSLIGDRLRYKAKAPFLAHWRARDRCARPVVRAGPDEVAGVGYQEYIGSLPWRSLRAAALERDGHRCRTCDASDGLEVHHRRYPPPGRWDLDDISALTTLCNACHLCISNELRARKLRLAAPLALRDTARRTPGAIQGEHHEPVSNPSIPDHRRLTPAFPQRRPRRPLE